VESAPLRGLLFPRVVADRPTVLEPISTATALSALIRQSPWLLADKVSAGFLLGLLQRAVSGPRYGLSLGLDTFANPALLEEWVLLATGTPYRSAARRANQATGQPIPIAIV